MIEMSMTYDQRVHAFYYLLRWQWEVDKRVAQLAIYGSLEARMGAFFCKEGIDQESLSRIVNFQGGITDLLNLYRLFGGRRLGIIGCQSRETRQSKSQRQNKG